MHRLPTLLTLITVCLGAPALVRAQDRGWVDVSFVSIHSQQGEVSSANHTVITGERAASTVDYPSFKSTGGIDLGVGFRFGPQNPLAFGVRVASLTYKYRPLLAAGVPHPTIANRYAYDVTTTADDLRRKDRGIDLLLMYFAPTPEPLSVRLFGGPTYFSVNNEMVSKLYYSQAWDRFGGNTIDITEYDSKQATGSAWGFNVGVDVSYFFSKHVGAGAVIRFNRGTITVEDPHNSNDLDLEAGLTTAGGGLRIRF